VRRLVPALAVLLALWAPAFAQADFGVKDFDVTFTADEHGSALTQAGAHPYAITTTLDLNTHVGELYGKPIELADGELRDLIVAQIPGLVGNPTAVERCSNDEFFGSEHICPRATQLGSAEVAIGSIADKSGRELAPASVYNLFPPPGVAARIGFAVANAVVVTIDLELSPTPPYNVIARLTDVANVAPVLGSKVTLWGIPADPAHDKERGGSVDIAEVPFLTLPRACQGPLATSYAADSWQDPGAFLPGGEPDPFDPAWIRGSTLTHDSLEPPNSQGFIGCGKLGFDPTITAQPTSKAAQSPTGLDFSLDVEDEGLTSHEAGATADSDIRKAVVTLPEGMSANPSLAEGLGVCTKGQLEAETAFSAQGAGCPEASKIGTVEVETPLLEKEILRGSLFVAQPYENEVGSLIALYVVIKDLKLGIVVKQALKVEPDPVTGRLVTVADKLPQLPFSHFRLHFREGGRSPLISPPSCGTHAVQAMLYPWSGGAPFPTTSAFEIISGPNNGPCPAGSVAPFHPDFAAGSINNNAKSFSPFYMRLTRRDGEQDMTRFSTVLPPGVVGKIAGLAKCSDAAIAAAKARTGPHGGQEELNDPSCPATSRIGRTLAGAGVGSQLTYVPGSLYLAGPVAGDPLSVVAITPALAGPFDAGTVVVRVALTLNPVTAEVEVDGSHSDPIPHILKGIPLNVRDLRVYADRPNFTLNPTDCEPSATRATLFGSFLNPLDPSDDLPVGLSARYQAANCAALGFKPKLQIKLKGGTKRGGHPALKAVVTPRPEDANFAGAVVTLPHSAFLDQAHIRTICTRVQFAANGGNGAGCPEAAIYGHATAWSPLLDEPLSGPVYLRSSDHNLPDLVIALHGLVDINLVSRIDSHKGGIRSSFAAIPDAPVSKFVLDMQGAKKGLIVNSTDLCAGIHRAKAKLTGQNGRLDDVKPPVRAAGC